MQRITRAFIAMGANLGNPLQQLDTAAMVLSAHERIACIAMSPLYKSIPHGVKNQPDFTNSVLEINTTLLPRELLCVLQHIETAQGRERNVRWGARTLDLDIILYGDVSLSSKTLTIPHPRAYQREFVIKPLFDLDHALILPGHGRVADIMLTLPLDNLTEIRHGITYHH